MWLDMNEVSNLYCSGEHCKDGTYAVEIGVVEPLIENLPYWPGNVAPNIKAIDLNATHYGDVKEIELHSTFGFMETRATYNFFK